MFEEFPRSPSLPPFTLPSDAEGSLSSPAEDAGEARVTFPIILSAFGQEAKRPFYRWSIVFSIALHVTLIGLTLWLNRKVVFLHQEPVAVLLRSRPPRPPPPPAEAKPEALRKGARGISLPKAVARDIQPEEELSFASEREPATSPTGKWVGGVGTGNAQGPGWSDGIESGAIIRRSLARDPQELNTGWECDFPEGATEKRVVVGIRIHVSDTGRPMHVTVIRPGPAVFNASAIECAMRERFHPARDMTGNSVEGDRELGILFVPQGTKAFAREVPLPPPKPPAPPPMGGPQPDLPVQLDDSPNPDEQAPPQG